MITSDFEQNLQAALVTRPGIEQAKGILVGLRGSTPEQAVAELRWVARDHGVCVTDLAGALVTAAAGGLPRDPRLRRVVCMQWGALLGGSYAPVQR
jgi:hypothetical protein